MLNRIKAKTWEGVGGDGMFGNVYLFFFSFPHTNDKQSNDYD